MKNGCKASLEINNSILAKILGLFIRDPLQRLFGLHDCNRMRKAFQVFCQAPLIRSAEKPLGKRIWIFGRQASVFAISGQLNNSSRPQHAVQVFV